MVSAHSLKQTSCTVRSEQERLIVLTVQRSAGEHSNASDSDIPFGGRHGIDASWRFLIKFVSHTVF